MVYDLHSNDTRYPKNWNKIRYFVFRRDKFICQMCGRKTMHPHCHHIVPVGAYNSTSHPNNLITLCERCHKKIHHIRD